ncbi:MAG: hypothetical protein LC635_05975, partial [Pseudonocardiaceae bacterium]|nr:hypothetical protein [Pseudonocardiaceae bacterium]
MNSGSLGDAHDRAVVPALELLTAATALTAPTATERQRIRARILAALDAADPAASAASAPAPEPAQTDRATAAN